MLLRIAAWQVEHIDAAEVRLVCFWIKEPDVWEFTEGFVVVKRETFGSPGCKDGESGLGGRLVQAGWTRRPSWLDGELR